MEILQANTGRDEQTESSAPPPKAHGSGQHPHPEHRRGLLLIGLFKLAKALLSIALGFGALKLLHHDVASVVLHIADTLKIDPESHLIGLLIVKANLISAAELRRFSIITFSYAVVCLVEGTGLVLEKRWAEYFTVTLTSLALPLECYELAKEFTPLRLALLVVNLLVVVYLVWLLRRQLRKETTESSS